MKHQPYIQISVPKPCHEDWQQMTPKEQGRFCNSCQKCVVDFTQFSDEELYKYMQTHKNEKVCGRFYNTQLNRKVQLPPQPHSQLYKWMMAAGLALVFAALPDSPSFAQAPYNYEQPYTQPYTPQEEEDTVTTIKDPISISGTVLDEKKEPIISAIVQVSCEGKIVGGAATDIDGKFIIKPLQPGKKYELSVKYIGYNDRQIIFGNGIREDIKDVTIKLHPQQSGCLTGVTVIEYTVPLLDKHNGTERTFDEDELKNGAY